MPKLPESMDCARVRDQLDAWLDGELSSSSSDALQQHLIACAACEAELRLERRIRSALSSCPQFDTPPRVIETILDQTLPAASARRHFAALFTVARRPLWITAAVACCLLIATTLSIYRSSTRTQLAEGTSVARASEDVRIALAQVVRLTRRAGDEVRNEALLDHFVIPTTRSLDRLLRRSFATNRDTTPGASNSQGVDDA